MANIILFLDPQEVKSTTYVDENADDKLIRNTIVECMDMYIHPILGTALYNDLKTTITSDSTLSTNANYKTLVDTYIQPALKYYVLMEGIDQFAFKISNKNVGKKNSENTQPASLDEIKVLQDGFRKKAELYAQRIINYLVENTSIFTLYLNPGTAYDTIIPKSSMYNSGWYLGSPEKEYVFDQKNSRHCCDE